MDDAEILANDRALLQFPISDSGNAELILHLSGTEILYRDGLGWLTWRGTRWAYDDSAASHVFQLALDAIRRMRAAALKHNDEKRASHALTSESDRGLTAMIRCLRRNPRIHISGDSLDADPWLLGCEGGTVDLRTGEIHEPDPTEFITRTTGVRYDPEARCPVFDRFLQTLFPSQTTREWIARIGGYSLTGIPEKFLFLLVGPTNRGKTTLIKALRQTWGDTAEGYAGQIMVDSLLAHRSNVNTRNADLASLVGKRLISTSEPSASASFDAAMVKQITSTDSSRARRLGKDPFTMRAVWKIWMDANETPEIDDPDEAAVLRCKVISFDAPLPSIDHRMMDRLGLERAGILRFFVEGCQRWMALQPNGLKEPASATLAQRLFRERANFLENAIRECLERGEHDFDSFYAMAERLETWGRKHGVKITGKMFSRWLEHQGDIHQERHGNLRMWHGIRCKENFQWI